MVVRWNAHRYLLDQSYGFFQNEFSGRIATKGYADSIGRARHSNETAQCAAICGYLYDHRIDTCSQCRHTTMCTYSYLAVLLYFGAALLCPENEKYCDATGRCKIANDWEDC